MTGHVIRGMTLSFNGPPGSLPDAVVFHQKGAVVTGGDGRISWHGPADELPEKHKSLPVTDYGEKLVMAGFIDPHIHFPQYRLLAAPGVNLLDWLKRFTYPEERRYEVRDHADAAAGIFLDTLARHGTTGACVFSTVHKGAAEALFSAAQKRNMALITGKTLMDRCAPEYLCDEPEQSLIETAELFDDWHGKARLRYALTPRFAVTSSDAQLKLAGEFMAKHPDCLMQTHLSESAGEIDMVTSLFPWAKDYTDVYARFGLLGQTALFGHGIHLSERECEALHESGSAIVHCPTSNTFLGSGLFDIGHIRAPERPVKLGLASDIGGGTSYCILANMAEAYKIAMLKSRRISAREAFYMATLGNAAILHLDAETGSLKAGKWADIVVLDPCATPVMAARGELSQSLEDILFALMILGDDRAVSATYIAGKSVHGNAE